MPTMFDPDARARIIARLERLRSDSPRHWGRMTPHEMVGHLDCELRHLLGEAPAKPMGSPLRLPPLRWLVIHVVPWPKAKGTSPPEWLVATREGLEREIAALARHLDAWTARGDRCAVPEHPVFGRLSCRTTGIVLHKHWDHHLRQFGV